MQVSCTAKCNSGMVEDLASHTLSLVLNQAYDLPARKSRILRISCTYLLFLSKIAIMAHKKWCHLTESHK